MVSKKIKRQAKEWANATKLLPKRDQINAAVLLRNDLLSKYSKTYVRACLTEFRKASKGVGFNLSYHLRISKKEQGNLNKSYAAKLSKAHNDLKRIEDAEGMINKAVLGLASDDVNRVVVCLILITGRRPVEVLKLAKFAKVRGDNSQLVFEGQAKTKGRDIGQYTIPVLGKAAPACIKALKKVRKEMDCTGLSNEGASRKYNDRICLLPTKLFKAHLGRCTPHDLRKAYAAICTAFYKPRSMSANAYISSIWGHGLEDISTANSYMKYYLD